MLSQAKSAQRANPPIRRTSRSRPYYPERCPRKKTFWLRLRLICAAIKLRGSLDCQAYNFRSEPLTTLRALAVPPLRSANGKRGLRPDKKWLLCAVVGFLPLVWISLVLHWGLVGVWSGLAAFMLLRLAAVLLRTASGRWAVEGTLGQR